MKTTRTLAMIEFGNALRTAREEKNARLLDLSDLIGVSVPFLSDVENGRRPLSDERIETLAAHLGADPLPLKILASKYRGKIELDISGSSQQEIEAALVLARSWRQVPAATVNHILTELKKSA